MKFCLQDEAGRLGWALWEAGYKTGTEEQRAGVDAMSEHDRNTETPLGRSWNLTAGKESRGMRAGVWIQEQCGAGYEKLAKDISRCLHWMVVGTRL